MRHLLLFVLLVPAPAFAFEVPAKAEAVLAKGQPYVEVSGGADGSAVVQGVVDIAAPAEVIWGVVTDCEHAPQMSPNLKSCRVLQRGPDGRWETREQVTKAGVLPSLRNVMRADYDRPRSIRFRRVDGDLRVLEGEWRLTPRAGGVRVTYESRIAPPFKIPGALARMALRREVPLNLTSLRREALARAR
jgi:uncharacterized membrane protein